MGFTKQSHSLTRMKIEEERVERLTDCRRIDVSLVRVQHFIP